MFNKKLKQEKRLLKIANHLLKEKAKFLERECSYLQSLLANVNNLKNFQIISAQRREWLETFYNIKV